MGKRGQRVLVVGYGFIGSHLVEELKRQGHQPVVITKYAPIDEAKKAALSAVPSLVADAGDAEALDSVMDGVDHVMFAATGMMPAEANADPLGDLNLTLPPLFALLEVVRRRSGIALTFFSSGGTVYGRAKQVPIPEEHATDPLGAYGITKLVSEKYIQLYAELHGIEATILRCSNLYGPGQPTQRSQGVIAAFLHRLLRDQPVKIFGEGVEVRDYVYVEDVVRTATALLDVDEVPMVLNVGAGEGLSVIALLGLLERLLGVEAQVERLPHRGFDVPEVVLDISKLQSLIGYEATPFEEGLRRTIEAARAELEG